MSKVVVIGSGFAGLSAACFMAAKGWDVVVLEKNEMPGGRARQFVANGFTFDMGPSWYWMPDVFERFFNCFGKTVADYYSLQRLSPSYRVYWPNTVMDIPADYPQLKNLFESLAPGSGKALDKFLQEAAYKYEVGINKLVYKPGRSLLEFADAEIIKGVLHLDVFTSLKKHISTHFKHPQLQQLLEFPALFLGALPQDLPALYSLMNYADIKLGTWYPMGGIHRVVEAIYSLAKELGVQFYFNHVVTAIQTTNSLAKKIAGVTNGADFLFDTDVVISNADYHFTESTLLKENERVYSEAYWKKKAMAPSCLIYYVGLNKKLRNVLHHSLFFDTGFQEHGKAIFTNPGWPAAPLFYVCAPSVSEDTVAPPGCENLFFLIPVAAGLAGDTEAVREKYFAMICKRLEERIGEPVMDAIVYKRSYSLSDFTNDYNAYKGNAYGLANTLAQTALLKPSIRSRKIKNLFFTGQLTVPGPGVPPAIISGEVVATAVQKYFKQHVL